MGNSPVARPASGASPEPTENTPLLGNKTAPPKQSLWQSIFAVENRILAVGFLITLSFTFTQVSLIYMFRIMSCDAFYDDHPPYEGPPEHRCNRNEIDAEAAQQFAILGMTTTLCGTINLFVSGWMVKRIGARTALLSQIFVPAVRVMLQVLGMVAGKRIGMNIIQSTQLVTIVGGPAGYILIMNIIIGEVVQPARRTVVFGKLQGAVMLGQAIGHYTGGQLGSKIDILAPFNTACVSFIIAGIVARISLPYIPPAIKAAKDSKSKTHTGFLAPLRVLAPQHLRRASGKIQKHYGVIFLCAGIFTGVLATDYAPTMIQLYASGSFSFEQDANGLLMTEFALIRSIFLLFLFPRIISIGRDYFARRKNTPEVEDAEASDDDLLTTPGAFEAPIASQSATAPVVPSKPIKDFTTSKFDLVFLRWSLVVDGILTLMFAFATEPWHIYLAAGLLPFGSGSAPAAKGVVTDMCSDSQRADALNAVTLVENIARLATQGLFGFLFSYLAGVGKSYLTFFCNAAIAIVGMAILMFSHFPPAGSVLLEEDELEDDDESEASLAA